MDKRKNCIGSMKYEDPKIDFENIERMYKESYYPKTRFSGWCPRVEPDRRGFIPSSMTYDKELRTTQVFQEKCESSAASSRDTYTGLPLGDIPFLVFTNNFRGQRTNSGRHWPRGVEMRKH